MPELIRRAVLLLFLRLFSSCCNFARLRFASSNLLLPAPLTDLLFADADRDGRRFSQNENQILKNLSP